MRTKQLLQRQLQAAGAASEERQPSSGLPGSWAQQQSTIEQQKQQALQQAPGHLPPRASAAAAAAAAPALAFAGAADGRALIGSSSNTAQRCSPVVHDSQLQPVGEEQPSGDLGDAAAAPVVPCPGWKPGLALRDPRRQPQQRQHPTMQGSESPLQPQQHQTALQQEQQPAHKRLRLALPVMPPPAVPAPLPSTLGFRPPTVPAPTSSQAVGQQLQSECTAVAFRFLNWLEVGGLMFTVSCVFCRHSDLWHWCASVLNAEGSPRHVRHDETCSHYPCGWDVNPP